jgi:uncharacterized protein (TIGR01732 family)
MRLNFFGSDDHSKMRKLPAPVCAFVHTISVSGHMMQCWAEDVTAQNPEEGVIGDMGAPYGGYSNGFALIVVLFILLIIVGTAYVY